MNPRTTEQIRADSEEAADQALAEWVRTGRPPLTDAEKLVFRVGFFSGCVYVTGQNLTDLLTVFRSA